LEWVAGLKEIEKVFDLCRKTLEEMVSIVIKSGKGYCIRWLKEHDVDVISIYIAAPEKLYVVRAIRPIRVRRHNYKVFIEEGDYTAEKIAMLEKKYGITTTIDGMPLTPKTEQQADVVK
jgi:phosphopantetheine adenylyltransferase